MQLAEAMFDAGDSVFSCRDSGSLELFIQADADRRRGLTQVKPFIFYGAKWKN
jgi:hypothetical protein